MKSNGNRAQARFPVLHSRPLRITHAWISRHGAGGASDTRRLRRIHPLASDTAGERAGGGPSGGGRSPPMGNAPRLHIDAEITVELLIMGHISP